MKLPLVKSTTIHQGHVFPTLYPCDCRGIGCEDMLDRIVSHVLEADRSPIGPAGGSVDFVELPSGDWLRISRGFGL